MTETTVARDRDRGNTEWQTAEAHYRSASADLREAMQLATDQRSDVDELAVTKHATAARALIETPATHLAHIAVKIRAADNMLALSAAYPELPQILVQDIFGIIGIHDPDGAALPERV